MIVFVEASNCVHGMVEELILNDCEDGVVLIMETEAKYVIIIFSE